MAVQDPTKISIATANQRSLFQTIATILRGLYTYDSTNDLVTFGGTNQILYPPIAIVRDEQAQNTSGGTATSGSFYTRVLNTTVINNIVGSSLVSNQLILPTGTFLAGWLAPAHAVDRMQTRLYDATNTTTVTNGEGTSVYINSTAASAASFGCTVFTLSGTAAIEVQQKVETTKATNGQGVAANHATEVYTILLVIQFA